MDVVLRAMTRRYRAVWTPERRARLDSLGMSGAGGGDAGLHRAGRGPAPRRDAPHRQRRTTTGSVAGGSCRRTPPCSMPSAGTGSGFCSPPSTPVADSPYNTYRKPGLPPAPSARPARRPSTPRSTPPPSPTCTSWRAPTGPTPSAERWPSTTGRWPRRAGAGREPRATRGEAEPDDDPHPLREALRVLIVTDARLAAPRRVRGGGGRGPGGRRPERAAPQQGGPGPRACRGGPGAPRPHTRPRRPLFVNDRVDLALALEADGVHVGPHRPAGGRRARHPPPGFLVGRSADDPAVARLAVAEGVDYIGCGTVYATTTKADAGDVIGLEGLAAVVRAVPVPVVAIGGITVERAREIPRTGAAGVAVVGAVMSAPDPAECSLEVAAGS
ncbi:MAG: thiamine phosphate synthase [Desulfomicrobium escambiense]|nr:thiamine phosphate synthase [Desulfomicrobium escambiense]